MSKSNIAILGAIAAVIIGTGYYAFAKASDDTARPKMIDEAISQGVISQEEADNLKEFGQKFHEERRQEMFEERINSAIEDGTITEDEANQIRDWQNQMPEAMKKLKPMKKMHKGMWQGEKAEESN